MTRCKIKVNHYDNLSINITKSGKSLEINHLFTDKIERMKRNNNEVKRVKYIVMVKELQWLKRMKSNKKLLL
ncbi:MAG: hypothetical protein ACR5KV_05965 [Wolbachia sp.]